MNVFSREALLTASMVLLSGPFACAENMRQPSTNGESAVYLDVDVDGRILEIDLITKSAKQVGDISSIQTPSFQYQWGKVTPDRQTLLLFFLDVPSGKRWDMTPYVFSRADGSFKRVPVKLHIGGDGRILPLDSRSVFVSTFELETREIDHMIFDTIENRVRGTFEPNISVYTMTSGIIDDAYVYLAQRSGTLVRKVNTSSGKLEQEYDTSALGRTDDPGSSKVARVRALYRNYVLATRRYPEAEVSKLFLVDLESERIVAESAPLTGIGIQFHLFEDSNDNVVITCIQETKSDSGGPPTAVMRSFLVDGNSMSEQEAKSFDPESQIVVTDETGAPVIIPRYRFDYLSMRDVQREIFRRLPTAALGSIESRKIIRDEVIEEFNNPAPEPTLRFAEP